jgi:ADP-ribose pyrophosphatase YjhB (NUDIX family)
MEYGESPRECAVRETREETNLSVRPGRLIGLYHGNDDPRCPVVLAVYQAQPINRTLQAGDDASQIELFNPRDLPREVAFKTHRQAIRDFLALER